MNAYDFLASLGFWQWVGVLCLAAIAADGLKCLVLSIFAVFRRAK